MLSILETCTYSRGDSGVQPDACKERVTLPGVLRLLGIFGWNGRLTVIQFRIGSVEPGVCYQVFDHQW